MDHDRTNPEPAVGRAPRPSWDLEEILGICLLLAFLLLAVAYVAAGIIQAGASPQSNEIEVTTVYATEWASPYVVLFPLAALAVAWWQMRRWGRSLDAPAAAEGVAAEDDGGGPDVGFDHLLRARRTATASAVALIVIVCAAIGLVVASLLLFPNSESTGNQVWPSEAETLANATAALVLCGIGLAAALHLWSEVSDRLGGDADDEVMEAEAEAEAEPVPAAD